MMIATHEMGFAREVADEVAFLHDGRIVEQGPPERVLAAPERPETQALPQPPARGRARLSCPDVAAPRYRRRVPEFKLNPTYTPTADQPKAIAGLAEGLEADESFQTLLGATGTGKTFTMAATIAGCSGRRW